MNVSERKGRFMVKDVYLNKVEIIERCLKRIEEVYGGSPESLNDYTKQDSIVLNLQRAIEASIDLAMHMVSELRLGIPQNSRDAFEVLAQQGYIDEVLLKNLSAMIGFRNIAVHNYQKLNLEILQKVIEHHLGDFEALLRQISRIDT